MALADYKMVSMPAICIGILYLFVLAIALFYSLWTRSNSNKVAFRILASLHCICFLFAYIFLLIGFLTNDALPLAFYLPFSILISVAHYSFLIFALYRLYFAFDDTLFSLGGGALRVFVISMMFAAFFTFVTFYFYWKQWEKVAAFCFTVGSAIYMLILVAIMCLFNKKLFSLTVRTASFQPSISVPSVSPASVIPSSPVSTSTSTTKSFALKMEEKMEEKKEEKMKQKKIGKESILIKNITKHTVLVSFVVFVIIFITILNLTLMAVIDTSFLVMVNIQRWFFIFERCSEVATIYVGFSQNANVYGCICKCCHFNCSRACIWMANRKMRKHMMGNSGEVSVVVRTLSLSSTQPEVPPEITDDRTENIP